MANVIDISQLTLNPKEVEDVRGFIKELVMETPEFRDILTIVDKIKMKQQLVFINKNGLAGKASTGTCERVDADELASLSQKYFDPQDIEIYYELCSKTMNENGLFKPLFDKIETYREKYDIEGTDFAIMVADIVKEAIIDSVWRLAFYGDTDATASTSSTAGVINSDNVGYFSPVDGYWKQIFDSTDAKKVDITSLQSTAMPTAAQAYKAINDVYRNANQLLRQATNAVMLVSDQIFEGFVDYLQTESINFELDTTLNGMKVVKFKGVKVVNFGFVFDKYNAYFEADSTDHNPYLQHRILMTIPENLQIGTLDAEGIASLDVFYDRGDRKLKIDAGYTISPVILDEKLVSVAY